MKILKRFEEYKRNKEEMKRLQEEKRKKEQKQALVIGLCVFVVCAIAIGIGMVMERKPTGITLEMDEIVFDAVNQSQSVQYTVTPENASTSDIQLVCENEEIAKFEGNELKSVSEGSTVIYAVVPDENVISQKVKVTVVDKEMELARQAQVIIDKIDAIQTVTLGSKEAIDAAEKAYREADVAVKEKVTNADVIVSAKATYTELEQEEAARQKAEEASRENTVTQQNATLNTESEHGRTVYIGKTGTKYHKQGCSTLKGEGSPISLEDAKAQGRTACKRCGG